jgi:alpha-1,2-mannosyltransferase
MGMTHTAKRPRTARALSIAVVAASAAGVVAHLWSSTPFNRIDLHIYFLAVQRSFPGHLYDFHFASTHYGFAYPPFAALVLKPLTAFSFTSVDHAWLVGSVAASAAFLAVAARELPVVPRVRGYRTALVAAGLWSVPVFLTARLGQINGYLTLAVMVDYVAARRDRSWAGVLTGVAAALKLTPAFAVIAFLACGYRRASVRAMASAASATALAFVVARHDSWRYRTREVFNTRRVERLDHPFNNSIRRLLTFTHLPAAVQTLLWVAVALGLIVVAYRRAQRSASVGNPFTALVIVMCCGFAVTPITWSHHLYFFLLVLPLLVGDGRDPRRLAAASGIAVLLFELHNPGQNPGFTAMRGVVLPLVVLLLPIDRVTRTAPAAVQS